jgi:hypothetical protein
VKIHRPTGTLLVLLSLAASAHPCDLCPNQGQPLSYELAQARAVVFGPVINARLGLDGISGTSQLQVEAVLKSDPLIKDQKVITLPRYVPPDPKLKFLVTLDVVRGQLDPYRGIPFASNRVVKYLQDAPAKQPMGKPEDSAERLRYYFKHLNDPETEIAADAFKEWATASNREVGLVASKLQPEELRSWLLDPKTPSHRLSLYGFLLGACGNDRDADLLRRFILNPDERMGPALDGLLAGYIKLNEREGWKLTKQILGDEKRPFTQRHSILRMLRFYHGFQPEQTRQHLVDCSATMLGQADLLDLAIDHLRQWQLWDLTPRVLALFGTKEASAPISKRAIVRYALVCPQPEAKRFIEQLKAKDPELVQDVLEAMQFDKPPKS